MKDFINHFRRDSKHLDPQDTPSAENPSTNPKSERVELAKEMINAYRETYADIDLQVLRNLIELKDITNQAKQAKPDHSYKEIAKRLGQEESEATLSQERWHGKIKCPSCGSKNIKRLTAEQQTNKDHRYQCGDCATTFNESSGTPIEAGNPPMHTWMFCWYLLGCTDSLQYIASKLGLELSMVEYMVRHMQKMFKAQKPLSHLQTFDEWSLKHGNSYKQKILHELAQKREEMQGENTGVPVNATLYRKAKNRAQDPFSHTPHLPTRPKNRGA